MRRLRKVRNPTDAKNAKLIKKQNIRYLQLDWSDDSDTMPQMEDEKLIAEALKPHLNIERLDFHHYGGSEFPTWMNSTCLSSLVKISLDNCRSCKHLPTLGLLPRLKVLKINNLLSVECIGDEFYYRKEGSNMVKTLDLVLFPALEDLELLTMLSLEEWKGWSSSLPSSSPSSSRMKEGEVQVSVFPVLKRLIIRSCLHLRTFPSLPSSIKHLELWDSNEKIFERSLQNLPHLSDLSIKDFHWWSPDQGMVLLQNLPVLQKLEMDNCWRLVNLPEGMQNLTSLKSLTIDKCYGLKSLNNCLQFLTNLHFLDISDCPELELLPDDFRNLVSLQHLKLKSLQKLGAVPHAHVSHDFKIIYPLAPPGLAPGQPMVLLHNLTTLQRLEIISCPSLFNLPEGMQNLTSLKFLTIERCPGLRSLNNCLQLLTNLHSLRIRECLKLELLPYDFQPLISLKVLLLEGFPNLAVVPVVGSLILKTISFSKCTHWMNLPEWITNQTLLQTLELDDCRRLKSLPEGFQQLTALQRLQVKSCHTKLQSRCKEDTGEDWHKIAHIPECIIGSPARLKDVPS